MYYQATGGLWDSIKLGVSSITSGVTRVVDKVDSVIHPGQTVTPQMVAPDYTPLLIGAGIVGYLLLRKKR